MNGPGLYMISGVQDLTGNALTDFYRQNKTLVWTVGTAAVLIGIAAYKSSKSTKKRK